MIESKEWFASLKVGDKVMIIGNRKRLAEITHITPSGRVRAAGHEYVSPGREYGGTRPRTVLARAPKDAADIVAAVEDAWRAIASLPKRDIFEHALVPAGWTRDHSKIRDAAQLIRTATELLKEEP